MKTWKIGTIAALVLTAIVLTAASAYAFCWWGFRPATNSPFTGSTFATTTPSTQYLPPVAETNTQTPTLYTPNIQVVTPGYGLRGGWGDASDDGATVPLATRQPEQQQRL